MAATAPPCFSISLVDHDYFGPKLLPLQTFSFSLSLGVLCGLTVSFGVGLFAGAY